MSSKLQFARILGAAAVLAGLLLAPSLASAHAGHAHPRPAVSAIHEATAPASKALVEVKAAPASPSMPSDDDASCGDRGCCSNGPCTGCHGFVLTSVTVPTPSLLSSSLANREAPPGSNPRDGRLRRPPKSFV